MSYWDNQILEEQTSLIENDKRINYEMLRQAQGVKQVVDMQGWKETIDPLITKMANDVFGAKVDSMWSTGIVSQDTTGETLKYYLGYRQAMIDLANRIQAYVNNIEHCEKRISYLEQQEQVLKDGPESRNEI